MVAFHLNKYLINNNLNVSFQSAHKSGLSTGTALVRVKNDIMMSIDQGKPVILVLLDLSAAFDTQLYISLDPDNEGSLKNLEHYIADIQLWMTQNLMKRNDNKNKYYIFGITTLC